jgi:predicted glycosyltransferase
MKVLVDIGHPAHVHLFKHTMWELERRGHQVIITARKKDVTLKLLELYGFPYECLSEMASAKSGLILEILQRVLRMSRIIHRFKPDLLLGVGLTVAQAGFFTHTPSITFTDSEFAANDRYTTFPFATYVCTPECFFKKVGKNHKTYAGFHELAYLHPKRFTPNPQVLTEVGLKEKDTFFIARFASFGASHDIGQSGLSDEGKWRLVAELSRRGRVILTSDKELPERFEPYRMSIDPSKIHDLLAYATMYIGEGLTMGSEAVMLGVPAIVINTLDAGTLREQEQRYGLLFRIPEEEKAIEKALELADTAGLREHFQGKRQQLLSEKIDVTEWIVNLIEETNAGKRI